MKSTQWPLLASILVTAFLSSACSDQSQKAQTESEEEKTELAVKPQASTDPVNLISESSLAQHIKTLASDEFGGRAPGTRGEEKTLDYLTTEFTKAGATPANNGSFLQAVPLASVEAVNQPKVTIDVAGGESITLNYLDDQVVSTRRQLDAVEVKNSEIVFVGYGINAPERQWNDYEGIDVKGKTVIMLVNDPGYATQDPNLFNGNAMTYYGRWDYKYDEAARQGAAAAFIIHDTKPAAYGWSTVRNSWSGPQFDMVRENKTADLSVVEGWLTKEKAAEILKASHLDLAELYQQSKKPGFKAVPTNLTFSTAIENKLNYVDSHNFAALIKGSENPDEVFVYMAHWDHLGTDPSKEGDQIYNGALDNATGTAGLIEIAKAFAQTKPKRSVLFLAVTAEEQGLLGSAYYAANPLFPLNKTVGGINMDGLNNFGPTKDLMVIGYGNSEFDDYLAKQLKTQGRVLVPNSETEKGYFYRSDHFELAKLGVPMAYTKPGHQHREKGEAYAIAKSEEYRKNHYHGPSDEYLPSWDMSGAVEDLQIYYLTGKAIANSNDWPKWNDGTEFKAIREEQMNK